MRIDDPRAVTRCDGLFAWERDAIDAEVDCEQTTLCLLQILADAASDPRRFDNPGAVAAAQYALVTLARRREPRAHAAVLEIARLPEAQIERVFESFVFEGLGAFLLATCGGDVDGIRGLLVDRAALPTCRAHAGEALALAVSLGHAERDDVVRLLASLLTPAEGRTAPRGIWVDCMLQLGATEHEHALRRAWDEGLLRDFVFTNWKEIERDLGRDPDALRVGLAQRCELALSDVDAWGAGPELTLALARALGRLLGPPSPPGRPTTRKRARNGPCWCGSGRKYKGCHLAGDRAAS